jgi:hypothetical protein
MDVSMKQLFAAIVATVMLVGVAVPAGAGSSKLLVGHATGIVVSAVPCSETEICQQATVSGFATPIGEFTGVLYERVDITTFSYTGTGVFTSNGGTIATTYTGQVYAPDQNGTVTFVERHQITGGTGRYLHASGDLSVLGTATVDGSLNIFVFGTLNN